MGLCALEDMGPTAENGSGMCELRSWHMLSAPGMPLCCGGDSVMMCGSDAGQTQGRGPKAMHTLTANALHSRCH